MSLFWMSFLVTTCTLTTILWHTLDASPALWLYDGYHRILEAESWSLFGMASHAQQRQHAHSLTNQTVWVTGASSGIGAAVVCELAKSTNNVRHVILSARRVEQMQQVLRDCQQQQQQQQRSTTTTSTTSTTTTFSIVPYDAMDTNTTTIVQVVQQAIESSPSQSIDMLILNSGIYQVQPAWKTSEQVRNQLFRVNVQAPIELSHTLMAQDQWKERGGASNIRGRGGHLVVVSSIMAKGPQSLSSTYAATKAALRSYFQSLSTEEGEWLTVSMILPGATSTNLWKNHYLQHDENGEDGSKSSSTMIRPDTGSMMTPQRVAQLLVRAIVATHQSQPQPHQQQQYSFSSLLSYWFFYEVWITKSSGLLYGWMSHYTPTIFYFTNHLVGWARLEAYTVNQMDMLEIPALIQTLVQVVRRKIMLLY
jgi:short-subunit dehydrogenase